MKQIIITLSILCMGIGGWAQTNPKIARLVDEAYSIEGSHVKFFCGYNGTYYESVNLFLQPNPEKLVPYFANDSVTHLTDSLKHLENQAAQRIYHAIRKTCQSLAQDAAKTSMWEYHYKGIDSIKYAILLKTGDCISPSDYSEFHKRDLYDTDLKNFHTLAGKESLKYEYHPWRWKEEEAYRQGNWPLKGWGQLDYRYAVDTVRGEVEYFDKKDYGRRIEAVLNQARDVSSRTIHLSHDSICSFPHDLVFCVYSPHGVGKYDEKTKQRNVTLLHHQSESHGILYTMHSKEQADSLLQQIISTTKSYLKEHPHIKYKFYPKARYEEALSPVFTGENGTGAVEDYRIFVHHDQRGEYHILTFDTKGELWIPLAWPELKTWKNGEATYYSRKMSELELTIYTRSRWREEREYTR